MPVNAKVAPQGQLESQEAILREVDNIILNEASDVSLDLHPRDIEMMTRQGDNLLVTLENGDLVTIEGFYADPSELSHLYLQGDEFAGEIFQVGLGEAGASGAVPFTSTATLTTAESALATAAAGASSVGAGAEAATGAGAGAGISTVGLVAGGVAVAAGVGVAAATSGDSASSDADTTAPDAPLLSDTNGMVLSGISEPGATIEVINASGEIVGTATADADGNFVVELDPLQEPGTELSATATDAAGNESAVSDTLVVPEDADVTAPNAPTITSATDDVAAVTGTLADGDSTNDATPTLTGSAEAGSTVTLTHNGEEIATVTADANGTWSFTPATGFADGEHVFSVTATDAAGNVSAASTDFTLTVDTTAPDAPVLTETDGETANGSTVNGSAEAGGTVEISNGDGDLLGSGTVADDGTFSITLSPEQDAGTELTATVTDAAGNESSVSDTLVVPEDADVTAPNAPTIASATDDVAAVTGTLTDGDSTNDATPTLTGSAEIGSTVTITHNGEEIGTTIADSNGTWNFTPATGFADGEHVFSVTATDAAANESAPSADFALTVDTTAPDAPILSETDGETANGSTVNGSAEAGGTVEITNGDGDLLGTGTVADDGTFSITLSPKQDAGTELTATVTDAAGNESAASAALTVPEDADVTAPNTPTIASATDDVAAVTGTLADGDSTNDATPTLTGSAEAGSTVTITHNGEEIATVTADANGTWSFTPATGFADGEHVFSVTATDAAGNESVASSEFTLTVDTTAPDAPVLAETDGETANGSTIKGSAEAGGTVEITNDDGDLLGSGTVADDGTFSITLSPKQDAGTELTATVTDAAGNESAVSDTLVVPEDADVTAPNAPTITSATDDVAAVTGTLADGDSTNDATPTLTGSAEAGSTVTLTHNGEEIGTTTADSNGTWSFTPATGFADGEHVFSVTATDAAGNVSAASTDFTLTVDTTAPDAPVLTETDGETANGSTVNGSAEAGGTVEISNGDGDLLGSGTVADDGTFSITLSPGQDAGTELTATVTDAAGNESSVSDTLVVPEDADVTAPNAPTIASATDDVEAVTGTLASGDSTNDATPTLTGSAEIGSTVTVMHNGEVIGTTTADSNGTWSFTPGTEFADGEHAFSVTATDEAGNVSAPSADFTLTVDTTAPDAPVLAETDGETANGSTVNGSAEAGGTVEITNGDGDLLGSGTVADDGTFSITLSPKQEAGTELTATVTDAAGNESAVSDTLVVPEDADVTAPNAPTIASATDDVEAVTGTLASGDSTNDATPTLTGSAEIGSTVTVTHNGEVIGTTIADSNGTWSFTPGTEFADGEHVFSVTATDASGNESAPSGEFTLTVDTTAPDAPILSETDGETANGSTVNGSAEAGGTVEITDVDGVVLGTGTVADDGTFSITLSPKQEAGTELTATVTDAAGNESAVSDTLVVPEDADVTAPNAPTIASATDDVEAVTGTLASGDSTNDATPTLTGSAEIGSTVTVTHNGEVIGTTIADSNGTWSFTPETDFADGEHVFSVTATDAAGNVSAASTDFTLTVDTVAPDAPVLAETDGETANGSTVNGSAEAGGTVEITDVDGVVLGTGTVADDGTFSITLSPKQEAGTELTATVTDAAGNESAVSDTLVVPEDADVTAPNTPTIASATDDVEAVTGTLASGDSTNDATPTLTGSAEIGSTVTVTHNGEVIGTTIADSNGTWSFTPGTEFADGEHVFSVTATDASGNESAPSGEFTLTVDTTAPDAPTLIESDGTSVSGTAEAGSDIEITNSNGDTVGSGVVEDDGTFSVALDPAQQDGEALTATATDPAGNTSSTSTPTTVDTGVDSTAPNAPTIASATDNVEAVTGTLAFGDSTNDATPTLTGSAEIGSTVTVTHNGEVIGTTIADSNGTWSFTPGTEFADGEHVFSVTAADAAGNVSDVSNVFTLTVDTTAPDAPTLIESDGTSVSGTAEAGSDIEITNSNGDTVGSGVVENDGTFSVALDPAQQDGEALTATATDPAGNTSSTSTPTTVDTGVDSTAPNAPTIASATDNVEAVTGTLASGDSTNDATPTLTGSAEIGSTVTVTHNGEVIGTTIADSNGTWSFTPGTEFADGEHVFSVTATDASGNESAPSGEFTLTVDTTAPDAPILSETDGETANGSTVNGSAEAGGTVEITDVDGVVLGTGTVADDGTFSITLSPKQEAGTELTATVTDAAGNESAVSDTLVVPEDADVTAPNASTIASATDNVEAVTGSLANGDNTNDATPTLTGSAEAGSTITLTHNGEEIGTTTADSNGTWSFTPETDFADGEHVFSVTATDAAGNESAASSDFTLTVDTTAPDAPVLAETDGTTVAGTGEAGTTVEVTNANDDVVGTAIVDSEGSFSVELSPEQEAGSTLTATATDGAGNESAVSAALDVPEDADVTAPNAPTIASATDDVEADTGALADGDSTNDATPTLTGSAEAGSTITITHNGEDIGTTIADSNGTWSFTPGTDFADGEHVFSVTATDAAGNESAPSADFTLTVDTVAPNAPILSETDGITVAGTGTGEVGTTVEVTNSNDDVVGTAIVDSEGNFSVELSPEQEAGSTLTATATDGAGNESAVSAALDVPEDADVTAPNAPTIASATDDVEADTGALADGDSTNDATPTLTGSAEAGSTITITHNGEDIGTTIADSNGTWSFTPGTDFADGEHVFSVTATDAAGNESAPSADFTLTVDTVAPNAPILSETDGITVAGTGEVGTTVEVTNSNDDVVGTAIVDSEGNFSVELSPEQEAGSTLTATATDAAGNESATSEALDVPEDADVTAPSTPTITSATDDVPADTGSLADGDSTNDATPTLTGSAEIGSTVTVTHNGEVIGTTIADSNGTWSFTPATDFADGEHVFSVTATDAAGNESAPSADFTLTVDTTAPDAPVLAETDGTTVTGTGEAGTTVEITNAAGDVLGSAEVDTDGNFSVALSPEQDAGTELTATVTDAAGNESAVSDTLVVPEDADVTAPNAPTIASATDDVEAVTGTLADGDSTNDATPTLTGSAEAGSTVTITHNGEEIATVTADANGTWSFTPATGFTDGEHVFSVTATDASGNESAPSGEFTLTVDTTAPDAPSLALTADTNITDDGITSNGDVTVSGLEADASWEYSLDGGSNWIDGTGTTFTLDEGVYTDGVVQIRQTDVAGNVSDAVNLGDVTVDATAPTGSIAFVDGDDGLLNLADISAVDLTGSIEAGLDSSNVVITITDSADPANEITVATTDITVDGAGNLSVTGLDLNTATSGLTEGALTVSMTVADVAGNTFETDGTTTSDLTVPDAPSLALTTDTNVTDDGITSNGEVTVSGLEADATWEYSLDGGSNWIDGTGTTFTLDEGVYADGDVQIRQTDVAGNVSDAVNLGDVTVDATAPTTTANIDAISDDSGTAGDFITNDDDGLTVTATLSAELATGEALLYSTDGTTWVDITDSVSGTAVSYADADLTASATVQLKVQDAAGNDGDIESQDVVIDTTAPTTTATIDAISDDSGTVGDFITNDDDGLTVTATLSAELATGEALLYSTDGTTWIDITDSVSGTAVSYADADLTASATVQLKVQDAAGNDGAVASQAVVIDAVAPTTTATIDAISDDSGTVGDFITNDDDGLTVTATLSAELATGEALLYSTDGTTWVDITDSVTGTAVSYADADLTASATVQLKVQDAAGNDGAVASQAVVIDAVAPTTTATIDAISDDSGTAGDFITNDDDGLTVTATMSAELATGEALLYSTDGTTWIDITDSVSGTAVSYADADLTASATVQLKVQDAAGNDGAVASQAVVIDAVAPTTTATIDAISDDSGTAGDFITNDDDGLTVTATLSAELATGEALLYSTDGTTWVDITDSVSGTAVSYADADLTASATVQLKVQDAAGNDGAVASQAVVIDAVAPTTTATIDAISDDSGTAGDFITNDDDGLTISATLDAPLAEGETLQYSTDGTTWIDITDSVSGTAVSYADADLTASATVQLKVQDAAGNDGAVASQAVVIDAVAPTTTATIDAISDDSGTAGDFITNDDDGLTVTATLSAELATGEALLYSTDGTTWVDITDSVSGTAVSYADADLTASATVQLKVQDAAGNDGAVASQAVVIDAVAPTTTATIDAISDDSGTAGDFITNDDDGLTVTATLSAELATGEALLYSTDGTTWIDITDSVSGTAVSYADADLTASATVQLKVQDAAGNDGAVASQAVVIDAVAPSTTATIDAISDDSGTAGDFITNDDDGLTITATLSAELATGEALLYSTDGTTWIDITDSVSGTAVSYADADLTASATVQLKVQDAAGNDGAVASQAVVIDAVAPTTTATIDAISDDSGTAGDFITNDDDGLTISATLDAPLAEGETLQYSTDGTTWIDITDSVTGTAVSYADASLTTSATVQLKVQDAAGNDGAVASQAVVIDAVAPTTTATIDAISDDSGTAGDFITNDDDGLTVTATLSAELATGEALLYSTDGTTWIDITDSVSGTAVSYADADLTASATVQLKVQDAAGNDGAVASQAVVIDAVAPTTTATIDAISDDSGTAGDFITNDDDGLTVTATLSAELATGEALLYSTDGTTWVDITDSVSGTAVSYADADLTASATVQLKVQDAAGNDGAVASQAVVIDAVAPTTTATIDAISDDSGTAGDFITNDDDGLTVTATLSAELATGEALLYSTDGTTWIDITDSVSGTAVSYADADLTASATVQLKVQDAAGNDGAVASQAVVIDAVAPTTTATIDAISDDSGTAGDFITNDDDGLTVTATLSAELATGEALLYSTDGTTWVDITDSVSGTAVSYADADLTASATVQLKVQDAAGNDGAVASQAVVIDAVAPTTTATIDAISDDSGTAGDFITNDDDGLTVTATLSAELATGEALLYSTDGTTWVDITDSVSGTAVSYADAGLTASATVQLKVQDAAGNDGAVASQAVVIDAVAPTTTATIDAISDDSGTAGDFITNDDDGLTISATLDAPLAEGETLQYSTDGTTWIDITDSVTGTAVSYADASLTTSATVQLKVQDAAGNDGAVASQAVVIDAVAPTTTATIDAISDDSGTAGDFITNDDDGLTVTATLSAELATGEALLYSTDGTTWVDITDSVTGTAVSYADADLTASATVQLKVQDAAGNDGAIESQDVVIDTIAPTTTATIDAISDDSGTVGDFITNDDDGLTISATLDAPLAEGETLQYSTDGTTWIDITDSVTGTAVSYADADLTASATVQLKVQDAAGNDGAIESQDVVIDTIAPTTTATIDAISDDSGTAGDFITNDDDGLTVTATLSAELATGEALLYSTDGTTWIDITDSVSGTAVSYADADLTASATVQLKVQDAAGNDGAVASQAVVIDAVAPTTTATIDAISDDSGTAGDFITNDDDGLTVTATLSAELATGEALLYSTDGTTWVDITDSVSGTAVSYADADLTASATVQLKVQDAAGNDGAVASQAVVIDAVAPTTTATIDAISDDSGTAGDFITNDDDGLTVTATLSAELATGEALLYSTDGTTWIDITDSVSGTAVSYADADLTASATVQLKVQDAAGNDGAVASQAVVIDAVAPTTTATIDAISDDSGTAGDFITNDDDGLTVTATLSAELATGEALLYSTDGTTWVDITDSVSGTAVSYADADLTASATVQLKVQDAAGNDGAVASQAVVIDAVAPTTTATIDAISDDSGTAGDFITNDDDGLTVTATLSAELATGEALLYSTDGTTWVDITDSVSGTAVSYADAGLTASATVQLKVQDAAGNDGAVASQAVVIDAVAPTTTATIDAISDDSGTAGDFITNDDDGLTISATLDAPLAEGETLQYSTDGTTWIDITDSVTGTAVSYADASLTTSATVQLKVQDAAGNDGAVASQAVVIDAVAPTTTATIDAISDDSGTAGDFITNDDDGLTVTATLSAELATGEALLYSTDGTTWVDITDSVTGTAVSYADADLTASATVQLKVQDAAGNDGAVASQAVVIDAVAPTTTATIDAISDDSGTAGDFITNDDDGLTVTATLSAELATGEALLYSTDGTTWIDITDSVSGTAVSYADADLTASATVQLKVQDAAGNDGAVASQAVVIDAVAPTTTATIDAISDDSGTAGDFITNDDDGLTITATLSAELATGEALLYSTDGTTWIDITDSVSGTAVSYADADLTASATVQLKVQDAAGNDGAVASQAVVIDAVAPTTTATIDAISDDSGTVGDFITNDDDGLTITATLDAPLAEGETLQYSTDGTTWVDITDSVSGTAVSYIDADLTASATVQLKVQDAAGNDGAVASQAVVIDAVAPTTTATIDAISDDSGTAGDFITNDDDGLTITATLSAELATGEALLYSTDGTTWIDITDSVSGTAVSYADADLTASATVQLKVQDAAGNDGAVASQAVVIDAVAPTTTATIDAISDDSGTAGDFITNDDDGLTVTATLSAELATGEALLYSTDGTTWIDITDSVSGTAVSYADADLTASATVQLKVQDAAGNDGAVASQAVVIDAVAPTTTATIDAISDDSGTAGDFITNDDDGLTVTATLSAELATGEALLYSTDGTTWVDITDSVTGTAVSYADASLTTSATVQLKVQDAAGNDGAVASQAVVIDAVAPTTTATIDAISDDSGTAGDFITNDDDGLTVTATLSAELATGEALLYSTDGTTWVDITDSVTGTAVSYADADLTASATVQLKVQDAAGNDGPVASQAIVIDVTAPTTAVSIDGISDDSGAADDFITNDDDGLTITATLDAALAEGETLQYSNDGGTTWTDISGSVDSADGITVSHVDADLTASATVQLKVQDAAGNDGPVASQAIVIDTEVPDAPIIVSIIDDVETSTGPLADGDSTNDTIPLIEGTAEANSTLTLYNGSEVVDIINVDGRGNWTFMPAEALADGDYTFSAVTTDIAGNVSNSSNTFSITVSTIPFIESGSSAITEDGIGAAPAAGRMFRSFAIAPASDSDSDITSATDNGALSFGNVSTDASFTLVKPTTVDIEAKSQLLIWNLSADSKTLQAIYTDEDTGIESAFITITIDDNGNYTTAIQQGIDHQLEGADSLTFDVGVQLDDGATSLSSNISIKVVDDIPTVKANQFVVVSALNTDYEGSALGDDGGFGADGGYVQQTTIHGVTFTVSDDLSSATVSGSSELIDIDVSNTIAITDGILTIETVLGETLTINVETGAYTYNNSGSSTIADSPNSAPEATISGQGGLLGIVDIEALGLIDLAGTQDLSVSDANNNITEVVIEKSALLGLNVLSPNVTLGYSQELADELGLMVTLDTTGIEFNLGIGSITLIGASTLTIKKVGGGIIDQQVLNEFLATVVITSDGTIDVDALGETTLTVKDSGGLSDSTDVSELIGLSVLDGTDSTTAAVIEDTEGTGELTAASETGSARLYGFAGDDEITGSAQADILRGGEGNDILNGGGGSDLIIGGTGDDTLTGGAGVDVFRWEAGDEITSDGSIATDTITDFDTSLPLSEAGGDIIDLSGMLQGEWRLGNAANNLTSFLHITYDAGLDKTIIAISTGGGFSSGYDASQVNHYIDLTGVNLVADSTTDEEIIASLLEQGKLIVDEANSSTVFGDITSDVNFTVTDGDGDTASSKVTFNGQGGTEPDTTTNSAPEVTASSSKLLGLIGFEALGLIDFSQNDVFVTDADGNLASVTITFEPLLSVEVGGTLLTGPEFTANSELAAELGLQFTTTSRAGLLGLVAPEASITITAVDGGDIDNLAINELLSTIALNDGIANVEVLNSITITATDSDGASTTQSLASLADVGVLDGNGDSVFDGDTTGNTIDQSSVLIDVQLYGYAGDDILTGGSGNDLIRGGDGNDIVNGGDGNDILFGGDDDDTLYGGAGSNIFDGGEGDDTLVTSTLTFEVDGGAGIDTLSFDNTGESIDLTSLLDADASVNTAVNIEVLDISASSDLATTLTLDEVTVLNLTDDDNELYIDGDEGDSVEAAGATSSATTTDLNGTTYDAYQLGDATLYIDQDVTVNTNNG